MISAVDELDHRAGGCAKVVAAWLGVVELLLHIDVGPAAALVVMDKLPSHITYDVVGMQLKDSEDYVLHPVHLTHGGQRLILCLALGEQDQLEQRQFLEAEAGELFHSGHWKG